MFVALISLLTVIPVPRASADSADQSKLSKQDKNSAGYFDWLIKSYSYYATIDACVKNSWNRSYNGVGISDENNSTNPKNNGYTGVYDGAKKNAKDGQSDGSIEISLSGANSGDWFASSGGSPSIGLYMRDASSSDAMKVGSDGLVGCDDNAKQLVYAGVHHIEDIVGSFVITVIATIFVFALATPLEKKSKSIIKHLGQHRITASMPTQLRINMN